MLSGHSQGDGTAPMRNTNKREYFGKCIVCSQMTVTNGFVSVMCLVISTVCRQAINSLHVLFLPEFSSSPWSKIYIKVFIGHTSLDKWNIISLIIEVGQGQGFIKVSSSWSSCAHRTAVCGVFSGG